MKNLPAREKLDLAEKVSQYLVLAGALDKNSAIEDFERANELSLELAMLLPTAVYRSMVEAASHPNAKCNPASVAIMMRSELIAPDEGALAAEHVAFHSPVAPERPKGKAH
ncbi:hypothetical protein BURC_00643 [Burkholderiaceae bacterium]|nr:hypothetical protein BURC_00643 [Burkholderiaceae bacterium]